MGTEDSSRHIACQPAMGVSGRIPDWVGELRAARQGGETVVFVAHSQGRAERVVEMLSDYQVPAAAIDRGEDAPLNAVLVAVGHLSKGFRLPGGGLQLWAETDVFDEERQTHEKRRSGPSPVFPARCLIPVRIASMRWICRRWIRRPPGVATIY